MQAILLLGTVSQLSNVAYKPLVLFLSVPCPPGRYYTSSDCMLCADGQYQDTPGQPTCKDCGANTVSSADRTTCIGLFYNLYSSFGL